VIRCTKFTALEKGALRGFCELILDGGMVIHDVMVLESNGKRWVNLPSKPQLDKDKNPRKDEAGKPIYTPIVSIPDRAPARAVQQLGTRRNRRIPRRSSTSAGCPGPQRRHRILGGDNV
jgi:DNA-binding cell septation regulator SpoVG